MCRKKVEDIVFSKISKIIQPKTSEDLKTTAQSQNPRVNEIICWGDDNYKYLEKMIWDDTKKICVAVGFNPTTNKVGDIDKTNEKIIEQLKVNYGGYYLINLYPQRSDNKKDFDEMDVDGDEYHKLIPKILEEILHKTEHDLLVFWGRTVSIEKESVDILDKFGKKERLWATVKKDTELHYHPARVEIEIKNFKENFCSAAYQFTGQK